MTTVKVVNVTDQERRIPTAGGAVFPPGVPIEVDVALADRLTCQPALWARAHDCPDCGRAFASAAGLASHTRTHDKD